MDTPARQLLSTWPLLLGMGLLMLGAGLQGTLVGLRATLEGFPTFVIGVVMAGYYAGYMGGSVGTARLIQRVGHIRVFAALSAIASVIILLQAVFVAPFIWTLLRAASGFCFAGIYVVAESWLNDRATNRNRGALLAVYMLVLYVGLGGGQFLLNVADPSGPLLFLLTSVLISIAVVPMTLSVQHAPQIQLVQKIGLRELYHVSPMGVAGVTLSGMLTGTLFALGPVYARQIGLDASGVASFMGVSILAAVVTQVPIGRASDRIDRRTVLITVCVLAAAFATLGAVFGDSSRRVLFVLAAAFGGIVLTLYSLSLSHINDHLRPSQILSASSSAILLNGVGATVGPIVIAAFMGSLGPSAYFASLAVLVGALAIYTLWRKRRRAPIPPEQKVPFVVAEPQAVAGQLVAEAQAATSPAPESDNRAS